MSPPRPPAAEVGADASGGGQVGHGELVDRAAALRQAHDRPIASDAAADRSQIRLPDSRASERGRRLSRRTLGMLLPLQLFLAAGWLRAGVEKVIDPTWWSGAYLTGFLDEQRPLMLPWFRLFADHVVDPLAPVVSWLVVGMQLLIAGCLIANRNVKAALWAGIVLNISFTMAGRVTPSAFYLVMQVALLFALARPVGARFALRRSMLFLALAALVAPFARTLHPAHVIDDPALMLSFATVIAAVTTIAVSIDPQRMSHAVHATGRRLLAAARR